jgi:prevent-host-death family protein
MKISATDAKNRLGHVLEQAQRGPVTIEKGGRRHSVLLSAEQYDALVSSAHKRPAAADPGKRFYEQYKDWVDEQNRHFEKYGLWHEDFRAW